MEEQKNPAPAAVATGSEEKKTEDKASPKIMEKISDFFQHVSVKDKLFFTQNLTIMLKAGISLSAGLKTLAKQNDNKFFAKIIGRISENVEKGNTFADSLKPYENIFGELFINMVDSGELSGKLEEVLSQLYLQIKKQSELISKVKGALTYPLVILFAMGGIGVFMMVYVVPKITSIMQEFGTELPLPTRILIFVSDSLVNYWYLFIGGLALFVFGFYRMLKTYRGRFWWQTLMLKAPVIGGIIKKINLARFARTISSLLKTDIMIIKSFQITASVLGNLHYRQALLEMAERIKKGGQINEVINLYPHLFPPIVAQMVMVGEQTGELDNILVEVADFYENDVDQIMNNLPSIIEPLLILLLGTGVGVMAVAVIMPMYSMTSAV